MNPSQLQNEEKKHEWTIVYDRAVPPAHSVTFASQSQQKPTQPKSVTRRGGLVRTLTPRTLTSPACRWVEPFPTLTENASEPPQSSSPVSPTVLVQNEQITELAAATTQPCLSTTTTTSEHTNDAGPRLPQRLPTGSIISPVKKSTKPPEQNATDESAH